MKATGNLSFGNGNSSWPGNRPKEEKKEQKPSEEESGQKGGEIGGEPSWPGGQPKEEQGGKEEKKEGEEEEKKKEDEEEKKEEKKEKKIEDLLKEAKNVLIQVSSHSMFGLSSHTLTVDETKLTITTKEFLGSEQIYSIPIKELQDVEVELTFFSATLKIIDKRYKDKTITLKGLKKNEALKTRQIIQGLMLSTDQKVDVSKLKEAEAAIKIAEVGKAHDGE